MAVFGYARVSTGEQSADYQVTSLKEAGAQVIYQDVGSGKNIDRPNLETMIKNVKNGDTVLVWKLDRLGRTLTGVFDLIDQLTQKGVGLKSLTEKVIDTTNKNDHIANAMLGMLAVFGQLERDLIRERVREGVAIAKSQGKMKGRGRPKALGVLDVEAFVAEARKGGRTIVDLCKKYRVSRKTYYNIMKIENENSNTVVLNET